jgi:hypothetical protein
VAGIVRRRNKILFISHCGIQVNERAGSEAKQAIKEGRDS